RRRRAFTRIHEFRHSTGAGLPHGQDGNHARVPRFAENGDEPYYPITPPGPGQARGLPGARQAEAAESKVLFGGRLGTYQYLECTWPSPARCRCSDNTLRPHLESGAPLAGELA
ncbi:UDP-galactopyranose mutase, partial [Rhodococcus hoagii]|nr:UDP-galactopyranose mutase [Prescottella equi]